MEVVSYKTEVFSSSNMQVNQGIREKLVPFCKHEQLGNMQRGQDFETGEETKKASEEEWEYDEGRDDGNEKRGSQKKIGKETCYWRGEPVLDEIKMKHKVVQQRIKCAQEIYKCISV